VPAVSAHFRSLLLSESVLCGVMFRAFDLQLKRSRVRISTVPLSGNNLGQVVHTHVPVSQSYLVPIKGRRCPAAGEVTVGLASHWPCVTHFSGLSTLWAHGLRKGDDHPAYTPRGVCHSFTFLPCLSVTWWHVSSRSGGVVR